MGCKIHPIGVWTEVQQAQSSGICIGAPSMCSPSLHGPKSQVGCLKQRGEHRRRGLDIWVTWDIAEMQKLHSELYRDSFIFCTLQEERMPLSTEYLPLRVNKLSAPVSWTKLKVRKVTFSPRTEETQWLTASQQHLCSIYCKLWKSFSPNFPLRLSFFYSLIFIGIKSKIAKIGLWITGPRAEYPLTEPDFCILLFRHNLGQSTFFLSYFELLLSFLKFCIGYKLQQILHITGIIRLLS